MSADDGRTVGDIFNTFTESQKKALYEMIGIIITDLNDDQMRVASFCINKAVEEEARKRVIRRAKRTS